MLRLLRCGWIFCFQVQLSAEMGPCKEWQILNNVLRQYKPIWCFSSWQEQIFPGSLVSFRHHACFMVARDNPISCLFPFPEMESFPQKHISSVWNGAILYSNHQTEATLWLVWLVLLHGIFSFLQPKRDRSASHQLFPSQPQITHFSNHRHKLRRGESGLYSLIHDSFTFKVSWSFSVNGTR